MHDLIGESFYEDNSKKTIKDTLLDDTALKIARSFCGKNHRNEMTGVSKTQLRRIFDDLKQFERVYAWNTKSWDYKKPMIKMIKSKTSYNIARSIERERGTQDFYNKLKYFIIEGINMIEDEADYQTFLLLFEAVYGYYYSENPKGNK